MDQWLGSPQLSALSNGHRLISYASKDIAIAALAEDIVKTLSNSIATKGRALITGCGGQTPKPLYARLADAPLLWGQVDMIILDERHVSITDERSNFGMMRAIFDSRPAAAMSLYGLCLDEQSLSRSQSLASQSISSLVSLGFDYALLGMGNDAHFASIFPFDKNCQALWQSEATILAIPRSEIDNLEPVIDRLSLSPQLISAIKKKVFFITGEAKRDVLLKAQTDDDPYSSPVGALMKQSNDLIDFVWCP
jgi:6-phosphogluconolactonase